jgi:hypothetical protein
MGIRRVVTGHDEAGHAVFASDEVVEPITIGSLPGMEFYQMWGGDEAPRFPSDGSRPATPQYFPAVGGFRFGLFTVPPDARASPATWSPTSPACTPLPRSTTSSSCRAVSCWSSTAGSPRSSGRADTVVQNGTRHAWRNPYDEPCTMVVAIVGAHHGAMGG